MAARWRWAQCHQVEDVGTATLTPSHRPPPTHTAVGLPASASPPPNPTSGTRLYSLGPGRTTKPCQAKSMQQAGLARSPVVAVAQSRPQLSGNNIAARLRCHHITACTLISTVNVNTFGIEQISIYLYIM